MALSFSRRSFFYLVGLILIAIALFRWRTTLKNLLSRPVARLQPQPKFANLFMKGPRALVGLAHGDDVEATVRAAIGLIGGIEKLDARDRTVLIKPNVVSGEPPPATTNPEVIRAMIKILREAGAKKVYVGDMSALLTLPTEANMKRTGMLHAIEEAGAEPVFFEAHGWVEAAIPDGRWAREVHVSEWIYKVDRVINVPVIKTHRSATYSICLKNFIGATHGRDRPYLINSSHWEEVVAELNAAYQPHLNVVDGTRVMVSGGPWSGEEKSPGLIIASGDRVAADVIGLGLIKHYGKSRKVTEMDVWQQKQIQRAIELGLGVKDRSLILLKAKSLKPDSGDFPHLLSSITHLAQIKA